MAGNKVYETQVAYMQNMVPLICFAFLCPLPAH